MGRKMIAVEEKFHEDRAGDHLIAYAVYVIRVSAVSSSSFVRLASEAMLCCPVR